METFTKMGNQLTRHRYLTSYFRRRDYNILMKMLSAKLSDPVKLRLHILDHYYKHGYKSTCDAFNLPKSTLYDWKKVFEASGKKPLSLVPKSTRPHHTRVMTTDHRLVEFIKTMRKKYGNVGANIIKPFLDEYAKGIGIKTVSRSTIEKVVRRRGFTFERRIKYKPKTRYSKLRTRRSPRVTRPGFIQMDSITLYINRKRHLFMSVIDIYTKYALVVKVNTLSSISARRVFKRFAKINPTSIHTVQTDNGSEFLAYFHKFLEGKGIKHIFIYPRLCKVNGVVERFNRTIQEECIKRSDELYYNEEAFEKKLTKYLYWYNFKRPHYALGYMSPIQFINSNIPKSG
jgi:putative transposase